MKKLILFVVIFCAIYRSSLADDKSLTVYAYVNGLVVILRTCLRDDYWKTKCRKSY